MAKTNKISADSQHPDHIEGIFCANLVLHYFRYKMYAKTYVHAISLAIRPCITPNPSNHNAYIRPCITNWSRLLQAFQALGFN